jgi:hypothetical protein
MASLCDLSHRDGVCVCGDADIEAARVFVLFSN